MRVRLSSRLALVALAAAASLPAPAAPAPNPVAYGAQPVVSPKGDRIAFLSNRTGAEELYVISPKGGGETRLTQTPETEVGLQWTADGKGIVFSTLFDDKSRIFSVDPKTKIRRELGEVPGRTPMLSPDGRHVLFMAGTWTETTLVVSELDGANAKPLTDGSSIAWNNHWSPDGKRIAFTGRSDPKAELAVFVMNTDGTGLRPLTRVPAEQGGAQWPVWSPDGRKLAIQVNSRLQKGCAHIWVVDAGTGEGRQLAAHDAYLDETPSWFPDGKRIAFQSNRTGRMEVWVMNADGTGARQVTGRK